MDSWVIVQTFINPQEAYMAKAFLESAGIETRMQDELTVRTGIRCTGNRWSKAARPA